MEWVTMEQLRADHGLAAARFVRAWKTGEPINGLRIDMKEDGAERLWRAVPAGGEQPDGDEDRAAGEQDKAAEEHPLDDSPVHGRTVNALADHGILYAADVLELVEQVRGSAVETLASLQGVGTKGARDVWCWVREALDLGGSGDEEAEEAEEDEEDEVGSHEEQSADAPAEEEDEEQPVEEPSEEARTEYPTHAHFGDLGPGTPFVYTDRFGVEAWYWKCLTKYHTEETAPPILKKDYAARIERGEKTAPYNAVPMYRSATHTFFDDDKEVRLLTDDEVEAADPDNAKPVFGREETLPVEQEESEESDEFVEPAEPTGLGHEDTEDFEDEPAPESPKRNATDGELVTAEFKLDEADDPWPEDFSDVATAEERIDPEPKPELPPEEAKVPPEERVHPGLSACRSVGRAEAGSEAWHEFRSRGIGSSDAGAILGLSPHGTPKDVWESKRGDHERNKPWLDDYADFGRWFESHLREHCELVSGVEIIPGEQLGTLQSIEWPRAMANLDGLDAMLVVIEELKTCESEWEEVPLAYVAQVQHQMFVTGATEARVRQFISPIPRPAVVSLRNHLEETLGEAADGLLAEWLLAEGEVVTWIVERDEEFIAQMLEREREFWGYVESGEEPPDIDPDGTAELDDPDVVAAMEEYALCRAVTEQYKPDMKAEDAAKKKARKAIEKAVSLLPDPKPKRITVGDHKATLVRRYDSEYWNLYAGGADDDLFF